MNRTTLFAFPSAVFVLILLFIGSAAAQKSEPATEIRPFDLRDKTYLAYGVDPAALSARKTGADGMSVFDTAADTHYSSVRVTQTFSAYSSKGEPLYWAHMADLSGRGFMDTRAGGTALAAARNYPVYVFPSRTAAGSDSQSPIFVTDDAYFERNPLGVARVYSVEFIGNIETMRSAAVQQLIEANGVSLDGTPLIRSIRDLESMVNDGLVRITIAADSDPKRPEFIVARVLRFPDRGAITPDAFLGSIKQPDGATLESERHFEASFGCMRDKSTCF